jgi:uncharacterized damage-inducible protein DinB
MDINKLLEYNIWANRLVEKQIKLLAPEQFVEQFRGSFGSIKATVVHLLESDWLWLNRFKGIPLAEVPAWEIETASDVFKVWRAIQDEMLIVGPTLVGVQTKKIRFRTRKGVDYTLPAEELVIHIANHGSYHRGQLTDMIRLAGGQPVSTDYFLFCTK